jgi:hypothetical protein
MSNRVSRENLDRALRKYCRCLGIPYASAKITTNVPGAVHFQKCPGGGLRLVALSDGGKIGSATDLIDRFGGFRRTAKEWHDMLMVAVFGWQHSERLAGRHYTWDDKSSDWKPLS